jgi:hypothetical protein
MSKNHMLLLNTWQKFFSHIHQEMNLKRRKHSSSCYLINGRNLKKLPILGIKYLIQLFSASGTGTPQQNRHIKSLKRLNKALENKQYCSAEFSGIYQAFNKVWHTRLLYKLRLSL